MPGTATKQVFYGAALVACLLALQGFVGLLEFDRQQILDGQIWRIWTGHLVHTDMSHLLLNVAAALTIYFLWFASIRFGELLLHGGMFAFLLSIALLYAHPELGWYNGLSGLLHALVACFALRLARSGGAIYWTILGAVWLKVLTEAALAQSGYQHMIGDLAVITEAHLFGALIGTLSAAMHSALFGGQERQVARQRPK